MSEIVVISLGGSVIVPNRIDTEFLKKFHSLILKQIKLGKKFIIVCGGGSTSRAYQDAARSLTKPTAEDLDWLGIHTTRLNAHLIETIFRRHAHKRIIKDPTKKVNFKEDVLLAAGWQPGCSTDFDAVLLAKQLGAKKLINLSNINYVYDKDPKIHTDAKKIDVISWAEFIKMLPREWDPGLNIPFDPVASKEAEKMNLKVIIMNGRDTKNLENYLNGKKFVGTTIV